MSGVFADTSYCLALLNPDDELHGAALEVTPDIRGRLVTTAWVLTEILDALSTPENRPLAVEFTRDWLADAQVEVVAPTLGLFEAALELYEQRPGKEWSLTDCVFFVVMEQYGLTEALSGDHHFRQAGYNPLLRPR